MRHLLPRVTILLLAALAGLVSAASGSAAANWSARVDPALLAAAGHGATAEFLVVLDAQADLSGAAARGDKTERGRYVYATLTAVASRSQAPLRALLEARGASYRPYWISNMIWVRGDLDLIRIVASRSDVSHIYANTWQRAQLPQTDQPPADPRNDSVIQWNIDLTNAPDVWAAGINGQGAVIGGQDTGYDWEHPAIMGQYRGWNGQTASHDYNWHDAIHDEDPNSNSLNPCGLSVAAPCDDDGHGTHTMGTMAGETPDSKIGMAPGARWIGCRNMESGWGSPVTYAECYEWFIAPYPYSGDSFTDGNPARAPHVINNSWSCTPSEGCAAVDILRQVVEAVTAAGIVTVHSAGNTGAACGSVNTPPALYDASFTVGATDGYDNIASFSSRGPVTVDGSDRLKPDIVAPGVSVLSSHRGGQYAYLSGTSMAAPHVAGLVALLISADPSLAGQVEEIERIITQSAQPLTSAEACGDDTPASVPNNVYGWGRIDALAAFDMLDVKEYEFHTLLPTVFDGWD